jgi:hypothetical protein
MNNTIQQNQQSAKNTTQTGQNMNPQKKNPGK